MEESVDHRVSSTKGNEVGHQVSWLMVKAEWATNKPNTNSIYTASNFLFNISQLIQIITTMSTGNFFNTIIWGHNVLPL